MEMSKSAYKRKRIDVACPAQEDASSFYKRLGLGILDASWKSEEAEPPRKRAVHNEIRIAPQNSKPTPRPDRVVPQYSQPQQTARQAVQSVRNFPERASYNPQHDRPHGYRTDFVNGGPKYQAQRPTSSHPHGYMNIAKSGPVRHQHTRPHSRTESDIVVTTRKAQPAPPPQRVVKKEPQVKPINRYAPPEYVTLMYHPTPTLEDLGLTSYLDSPPSSPRSVSPHRGSEAALPYQTVSVTQQSTTTMSKPKTSEERPHAFSSNKTDPHLSTTNRPQGYTPSFAPKGWVPPKAVHTPSHGRATAVDITRPVSQSALTSRPHYTAANTVTRPAMVETPHKAARDWNQHLSTNTPQGYTPSFAPKGWVPPKAIHKPSHGRATAVDITHPVSLSALTSRPHHTTANAVTSPAMVETPHKAARDWLSNDGASIDKTENLFGGVTPHSCLVQSRAIDQRFS